MLCHYVRGASAVTPGGYFNFSTIHLQNLSYQPAVLLLHSLQLRQVCVSNQLCKQVGACQRSLHKSSFQAIWEWWKRAALRTGTLLLTGADHTWPSVMLTGADGSWSPTSGELQIPQPWLRRYCLCSHKRTKVCEHYFLLLDWNKAWSLHGLLFLKMTETAGQAFMAQRLS